MKVEPTFDVTHVGNTIVMMANLPLDANIQYVTIAASKMPWIAAAEPTRCGRALQCGRSARISSALVIRDRPAMPRFVASA